MFGFAGKTEARIKQLEDELKAVRHLLKQPSYILEMVVQPKWAYICEFIAERAKISQADVFRELRDEAQEEWHPAETGSFTDTGRARITERYRFLVFRDDLSGLEAVWSDAHRSFRNDAFLLVYARIFEKLNTDDVRMLGCSLPYLAVSPHLVLLHHPADPYPYFQNLIPTEDIRVLLVELSRESRRATNRAFKTFPPRLREKFQAFGVSYHIDEHEPNGHRLSDWDGFNSRDWAKTIGVALYEKEVAAQHFSTAAYDLRMRLHTFEPDHRHFEKLFGRAEHDESTVY